MAETVAVHEEPRGIRYTMLGGSVLEGLTGASAVVLTILGLVGIFPFYMVAIGVLAIGAALILEGFAVSARLAHAVHEATLGKRTLTEFGGGVAIEYFGGLSGIALGILGLAGIASAVLLPVAVIVFGVSHVLGSATTARVRSVEFMGENEHARLVAHQVARSSADVQGVIGLGGIVLGILALIGFAPMTLTLISLLGFGFADLLRAPAITARAMTRAF